MRKLIEKIKKLKLSDEEAVKKIILIYAGDGDLKKNKFSKVANIIAEYFEMMKMERK